MELEERFTHWYESPANIKHLTVKHILQIQNNKEYVNLLDEENTTSVQSPEDNIPVGIDEEVPNYEEENKMLRKNLLRDGSVVHNLTDKIKNTKKNVERAVRQEVKKGC